MLTRVTGNLRLIKSYFKELAFIQVALYKCNLLMCALILATLALFTNDNISLNFIPLSGSHYKHSKTVFDLKISFLEGKL